MHLFEVALGGSLVAACLLIVIALARCNERRRRDYIAYRAHVDERDTLARFRRIMGRNR